MILELHTLAQRLGRTPTVTDIQEQARMGLAYSLHTYEAVFGRYSEALRRARLTPKYPNQYDQKKMIAELRAFRKKFGRPLTIEDVRKARNRGEAVSAIYHYTRAFGSVGKAIAAAAAGKQRDRDRWEMIQFLKELDAELGRVVIEPDILRKFNEGRGPSSVAILKEFGSLQAARRAAGIRLAVGRAKDQSRYGRTYTDEELIAYLKKLGRELRRTPGQEDLRAASAKGLGPQSATIAKRFGTLTAAFRKAGFTDLYTRSYTEKQLEAYLRRLSRKLGRFPSAGDMNRASREGKGPCATTVLRKLGPISKIKKRFSR
jgi:hypothetical protein